MSDEEPGENETAMVSCDDSRVKNMIYTIHGGQVMPDSDLAKLYKVETGALNRVTKRDEDQFLEDFRFRVTREKLGDLRCQIGISASQDANSAVIRTYLPYVCTEQSVTVLAGVLRNRVAVQTNMQIMRAFVEMRHTLANNAHPHRGLRHGRRDAGKVTQLRMPPAHREEISDRPLRNLPRKQPPRVPKLPVLGRQLAARAGACRISPWLPLLRRKLGTPSPAMAGLLDNITRTEGVELILGRGPKGTSREPEWFRRDRAAPRHHDRRKGPHGYLLYILRNLVPQVRPAAPGARVRLFARLAELGEHLRAQQPCEPPPLVVRPASPPLAVSCQASPRLSSACYLADNIAAETRGVVMPTVI